MDYKSLMERDGFILVKNVFSREEIINLKDLLKSQIDTKGLKRSKNQLGTDLLNAAVEIPKLDWVFINKKILTIMNKLISKEIIFTCHCDAFSGIMSPWHKDDGTGLTGKDKGYFEDYTYGKEDVQVYKIALYLQSHKRNSAGLSVVRGSHKTNYETTKKILNNKNITLHTNTGDIIIFDVRLTHSGQKEVIPMKWTSSNIWIKNIQNFIQKIPKINTLFYLIVGSFQQKFFGKKMALFWTYGANNHWTSKFAKNNMKRQLEFYEYRNIKTTTNLPYNTKEKLEKNNIIVFEKFK